jgi:hypothetical protein
VPTNYPTTLDTDTELYDVTDDVDDVIASHHDNIKDAVKALEAKVGINASAVTTSIDHHLGVAMFMQTITADDTTASTSYEDFASLTMDLVVSKTSSVFITLTVGMVSHSENTYTASARIVWSGTEDATTEATNTTSSDTGIGNSMSTSLLKTGITAATYTVHVHIKTSGDTATFTNGVLTAIVIPESL